MDNIVAGTRPHRPPGPNEWLSDSVWDMICRCWLASWDDRPDAGFVANAIHDAGDVVEFRRNEPDLVAFLDASMTGVWGGPEVKKAQELADMIDLVRRFGNRIAGDLTTRSGSRKRKLRQEKSKAVPELLAETVWYLWHSSFLVHTRANAR